MSLAGLADRIGRSIRRSIKNVFRTIRNLIPISKIKTEKEDEDYVPEKWIHRSDKSPREIRKGKLYLKKGKVVVSNRKVYHWPWLRYVKRGLAALLLLVNFVFTQFLLIGTGGLQVISLFFFGNCFILADYLWKTRRAPAEE